MDESKIVVYGAIAGNVAIAATKFIVAGITGSSAMLSEGIHSTVDTGNDLLLLMGMKRSQQEPDPTHPFGYGKALYFWSLMVAVLIFGVGGGVSIVEGVQHILHAEPLKNPFWNYVVLAVATLFEGASFTVALRAFLKEKGDRPFWRTLHRSKDPTNFTVMAEDSAALAGLMIAALGIYSAHHFNLPWLDGASSVVIGILLAAVASLLIYESGGLLIGEGVSSETAEAIRKMVMDDEAVEIASRPLSMYLGPDSVLLTMDVYFKKGISSDLIVAAVRNIEQAIRTRYPLIKRIYIEAVPAGQDTIHGL
ncbi:MAG TPA: cation diffusion facilitator family transporter [Burkholderiaceae bacterium]|jgi:cation diffusion facilitator family transporter